MSTDTRKWPRIYPLTWLRRRRFEKHLRKRVRPSFAPGWAPFLANGPLVSGEEGSYLGTRYVVDWDMPEGQFVDLGLHYGQPVRRGALRTVSYLKRDEWWVPVSMYRSRAPYVPTPFECLSEEARLEDNRKWAEKRARGRAELELAYSQPLRHDPSLEFFLEVHLGEH